LISGTLEGLMTGIGNGAGFEGPYRMTEISASRNAQPMSRNVHERSDDRRRSSDAPGLLLPDGCGSGGIGMRVR
jgi:hypothetical protein